jgi:succinate-acetate transporter protein
MTALNNPEAAPGARFADPGPLGLAAFALTTFVLSFANAGLIGGAGVAVLGLALFYGGIGQVIAGIWEFANKNTFGATAFTSYGLFWMAAWFLLTTGGAAGAGPAGLGLFFLIWGIFTLYMTFAAIKTNLVLILVFIALTITFFLLAFGAFGSNANLTHVGGYFGILTAIFAFYGSFAGVMNSTWKRVVLPVWPSK